MSPDRTFNRRRFIATGAGALAAATAGLPAPSAQAARHSGVPSAATGSASPGVALSVDASDRSRWAVARTVFGRFFEVNERKPYPGIIDQHLSNGSFEDWWVKGRHPWNRKTTVLYRGVRLLPGVAYPWEPVPDSAVDDPGDGVELEMPEGGVHGRRADGETQRFQRVRVRNATGGVRQRLALPDERTLAYDLSLWVRGVGVDSLTVQMQDSVGDLVAETSLPVTGEWTRHQARLRLAHRSGTKFPGDNGADSTFGEFTLLMLVSGTGHVDLDGATLMAGDALRGKFNPTTVQWFRDLGITSIRWPGGNYTSLYHWEHGIGPWQDRPVTRNQVWGGLDYYYFGLAEYLELCQILGTEPYVNLGFNTPSGRGWDIAPEEAARAVEYCNGDISTEMGALRAAHGYPASWNVTQWQVGNEVWGPRQNGHTDARTYAEEFKAYYDAMKAADPAIRVYASGNDVWHLRLGDPPGTPPTWNTDFLDVAGADYTDGLDIHNYVNGIRDPVTRAAFMSEHHLDPVEYNQLCVAYPTGVDRALTLLRDQARERGVDDLKITYGEFMSNPRVDAGWPHAHRETVALAAFVAGMYNTFIRQGDAVRHSHFVDNTTYYRPTIGGHLPLSPANHVGQLYTEPFAIAGLSWHQADVRIAGPTIDIPEMDRQMPTRDVPLVDAACLVSGHGLLAYVFAVNRDLKHHHQVALSVANWPPGDAPGRSGPKVDARMLTSVPEGNPFVKQESFTERTTFAIRDITLTPAADGTVIVTLPPAATVRIRLDATG